MNLYENPYETPTNHYLDLEDNMSNLKEENRYLKMQLGYWDLAAIISVSLLCVFCAIIGYSIRP